MMTSKTLRERGSGRCSGGGGVFASKDYIQIIFFLLYLISGINHMQSLKCYTCGETNNFLGSNYTTANPYSCQEFESSDRTDLVKFIIECPIDYLGCITQIQGDIITRTCDTFAIDDCQTANGVTYCYCNYDLCNDHSIIEAKILQQQIDNEKNLKEQENEEENSNDGNKKHRDEDDESDIISDDEDYVDMSGFGDIKTSSSKFDDGVYHKNEDEIIIDNDDDDDNFMNMKNTTNDPGTAINKIEGKLKTNLTTFLPSIFTTSSTTEIQNRTDVTMNITTIPIKTSTFKPNSSSVKHQNVHNHHHHHNSSVNVASFTSSIQYLVLVLISRLMKYFM